MSRPESWTTHQFGLRAVLLLLPALAMVLAAVAPEISRSGSAVKAGIQQAEPSTQNDTLHLPAEFERGQVFLRPVTAGGDTLRLFLDTAGPTLLYADVQQRHDLEQYSLIMQGEQIPAAPLPEFRKQQRIPSPKLNQGLLALRDRERQLPHRARLGELSGILGQNWFAGGRWRIDYPGQKMAYLDPSFELSGREGVHARLHFRRDGQGRPTHHYPRIEVQIAGQTHSMVLQIGGYISLTQSGARELGARGHSWWPAGFISESLFDQWRNAHPQWLVIDQADATYGSALIEVPRIRIEDRSMGPAWFAVRDDEAYTEWMSQFTDRTVVGALGPNVFSPYILTMDYPSGELLIQTPEEARR